MKYSTKDLFSMGEDVKVKAIGNSMVMEQF
jgi:hypothetical protein